MTTRFGTQPHIGLRYIETVTETVRPLVNAGSWGVLPTPANAATDANSAAAVAKLVQETQKGLYVNRDRYSGFVFLVPPSQPLVPVKLTRSDAQLQAVFATGLPIPASYTQQGDTDDLAAFHQPDYVSPNGAYKGRIYEAWQLRANLEADAAQFPFTASWGGRMVDFNRHEHWKNWQYSGYRYQYPGDPDSTYEKASWGATATGIPLATGRISDEDIATGEINHAVGVTVEDASAGHWWPAVRNDGSGTSSPLKEGMRFTLPPDHVPQGTSAFTRMLERAATKYCLYLSDRSVGTVTVRADPTATATFDGQAGYDVLKSFPWAKLRLLKGGAGDSVPFVA